MNDNAIPFDNVTISNLKKDVNHTQNNDDDIIFSISGGAGLFPAAFGACYQIDKYIKDYLENYLLVLQKYH